MVFDNTFEHPSELVTVTVYVPLMGEASID